MVPAVLNKQIDGQLRPAIWTRMTALIAQSFAQGAYKSAVVCAVCKEVFRSAGNSLSRCVCLLIPLWTAGEERARKCERSLLRRVTYLEAKTGSEICNSSGRGATACNRCSRDWEKMNCKRTVSI